MTKGWLNTAKWPLLLLLTLGINAALYLAMSGLSRKQENNRFSTYEKSILLTIPKEPPPLEKERRKPLKKKKLQIKKLKMTALKQPKTEPPPSFELGQVSGNLAFDTQINIGVTPDLPLFQAPKTLFNLSELDQKPRLLYKVNPIYPYAAKRRNLTGSITLQFVVDSNGNVSRVKVLKSEPTGVFDESAIRAVEKWRFKPGVYEGEAVSTKVVVPINFQL